MLYAPLVQQDGVARGRERKVEKPPLVMRGQREVHLQPTDPQVGTAPAWVLSPHPMGAPSLQVWYPATPFPSPGITALVWSCLMGLSAL